MNTIILIHLNEKNKILFESYFFVLLNFVKEGELV